MVQDLKLENIFQSIISPCHLEFIKGFLNQSGVLL